MNVNSIRSEDKTFHSFSANWMLLAIYVGKNIISMKHTKIVLHDLYKLQPMSVSE